MKVPAWKAALGKALSRYLPAITLPTAIPPAFVSRDPATIEEYATDQLIGKVASARWLTETEKAQAAALSGASTIQLPVLMQQGGTDKIADPASARAFFDGLGSADKTYTEYPEHYHEIWFDLDREPIYAEVEAWLDARYPAKA